MTATTAQSDFLDPKPQMKVPRQYRQHGVTGIFPTRLPFLVEFHLIFIVKADKLAQRYGSSVN